MIHTASQLKALVRNKSLSDSSKAQIIFRNYVMERFLERLSLSAYRDNLILKGGVLVSAMVGLDSRSTMDVDATIRNLPLSIDDARNIVENIMRHRDGSCVLKRDR
jgi:predicted nucleotidyltransferase component of viral defense system